MSLSQIAEMVMNESDNIIYVADVDTHELVYMNAAAKSFFGRSDDESYVGKKCHQFLRGSEKPCSYCTNAILNEKEFYKWEMHDERQKEDFLLKDKLVKLDGRTYRLEIAVAITQAVRKREKLALQLEREETLVKCIQTLTEGENVQKAIERLLAVIAGFYKGDRGYLFEIDYGEGYFSNTYEWVDEGITKEIDQLQRLPLNLLDTWMEHFLHNGEFYITSLNKDVEPDTLEYELLDRQGIQSLIAAPLYENGRITGFLGVDNPRRNYEDLTLLRSVNYFIRDDLNKRKIRQELEKASYMDSLTGLCNRNCFYKTAAKLRAKGMASLGIVYIDLDGLKKTNDAKGHLFGDKLLSDTADILMQIYEGNVFRMGGDEFVVVCPDIVEESFLEKKEKVRQKMKNAGIQISLGSSYKAPAGEIEELLVSADRQMYRHKQEHYHKRYVEDAREEQTTKEAERKETK